MPIPTTITQEVVENSLNYTCSLNQLLECLPKEASRADAAALARLFRNAANAADHEEEATLFETLALALSAKTATNNLQQQQPVVQPAPAVPAPAPAAAALEGQPDMINVILKAMRPQLEAEAEKRIQQRQQQQQRDQEQFRARR